MAAIGRPRAFDIDVALDAALEVFWRHGFEGTSIADLIDAMGINRPALYHAFKDKKALFYRAVERYLSVDAQHTFSALAESTARDVTTQYLVRSVEQLTDPDRPMGCFVLRGAFACGPENEDVARRMLDVRDGALDALAKRYVELGHDLREGEDPRSLARYVLTVRHGLAVLACGGAERAELLETAGRSLAGLEATGVFIT
ncbi:TetR/AcrR family transcriptional regulator [Pseudonocardia adelaidensis]|uniref:TetR/AcrR family transcriptional regulator n=1 Tax=Pseudonocardia adelaidensis TaxID=648754 RepID=A0ABP9P5J5_9PSEU